MNETGQEEDVHAGVCLQLYLLFLWEDMIVFQCLCKKNANVKAEMYFLGSYLQWQISAIAQHSDLIGWLVLAQMFISNESS